ncbi:efflux RND transporter periplasmic adaptor subunit [Komagataeibacter diospyri]|uniref:Multidrug efflux pump acriflavin resistance protein AcrB/AcrD/AcrF n=1 Tax=Komagataeibacter diospyri TaxID=1932662 RepID=A0A4P5NSD9_9PROT|nr:efflux RND transporter periplasmic adaptor subunit [Komagataeibacter diospyri]GCE83357.1 multidrug efflux pump acriflavin resistance protein AcrB/AcrD/AcrF [Komagataeibacter diospyri]GCE90106.1 multidrug efflux pump acriflavin resistance protein AcrB/AcrD/AcrF [Komagataeibacter diospyri]
MTATGENPRPRMSGRARLYATLGGVVVAAIVAGGILERRIHVSHLKDMAQDAAIPRVQVILPQKGPKTRTLDLPGNISAWYQAPIFAQVSGYVQMWYKDIGAKVKAGEILATIDTPGLDAQYAASKANFDVAMARYRLAQITAKRWRALQGTQAVSQQEVDVQAANAEARQAEVEAARHEVSRFAALIAFKQIVAPFDGVVTSRLADVGDYVNAGGGDVSSRGTATELFSVADVHRMRVFVSVPQDYADIISPKLEGDVSVPQYPGRVFKARFLATAKAFNAGTRTVTTELVVDNDKRELWPDSYANVHFVAPGDPDILIIPEGALVFRAQGMQVAVVDADDRIRLRNVTVGTNLGTKVQVLAGIGPKDRIVNNPSAGLLEGQKVYLVGATPGYNDAGATASPAVDKGDDVRAMPAGDSNAGDTGVRQ